MKERHWYMGWVVNDWMTDPAVSLLKESTRGIFFDALCCMFLQDRCGQIVGTIVDLARLCRTTPNAMRAAVDDIRFRNAADVSEADNLVTLKNRRMSREYEARKSSAERKKRQRCGNVTQMSAPCHADVPPHSKSKSHSNKKNTSAGADWPSGGMEVWKAAPPIARERSSKREFFDEWKRQQLEGKTPQVLISLALWKRSKKWTDDGGRAIEGLHRWVKNRKWEEPPETNARPNPVQSADAARAESAGKMNAEGALRRQVEADREKTIATLKALPLDRLAELKRQCVEAADPKFRANMEKADPLTGGLLGSLMVSRMKAEQMAGAA